MDGTRELRIGFIGCGHAAGIHMDRFLALDGVRVVGCADADRHAAQALADRATAVGLGMIGDRRVETAVPVFTGHAALIHETAPDAIAVFTPHLAHYRPTMDALQAGCHVFVEKPLSTSAQEAADIVGLAQGRKRLVGVGHQYRLLPSLIAARARLAEGTIGALRLVSATLAQPWLEGHGGAENSWRFDPKIAGGGLLADAGDHLLDALLWSTGRVAVEVAAVQSRLDSGLDVVTAAAIQLSGGVLATVALSGISPDSLFEMTFFGELGRLHLTDRTLVETIGRSPPAEVGLPEPGESIDANFVAAIAGNGPLCCPADEALDAVRLLDAIGRSAATGQVVRPT
ncbi:Gfo/Idh/MocA family oxidoreductase [Isosphaeraceae bacterium EP7]